jgi:hypothetical protein
MSVDDYESLKDRRQKNPVTSDDEQLCLFERAKRELQIIKDYYDENPLIVGPIH